MVQGDSLSTMQCVILRGAVGTAVLASLTAITGCGVSDTTTTTTKLPGQWLDSFVQRRYPPHYKTLKLGKDETILLDGLLDEAAWTEVPFTVETFVDIAQPRHPNYTVPSGNFSRVKVRWDAHYLYVGAELGESLPERSTVVGHTGYLNSSRRSYGYVPYFDNDFEVFVDASMSNWYYKEFEMNFLNATYDVLWRAPDNGLGSVGVPCDQSSPDHWCQNTTFTATSQHGPDTWTMFNRNAASPGMQTATALIDGGWSLEIAFPIRGSADHGGLIDAEPLVDNSAWDPENGARYWWADFSRAEHPRFNYWLVDDNSSNADLKPLCQAVQEESPELLGLDKWSCYWEWTWASVGGHAYMHNPDTFGFLEFADADADADERCGNVEWPVRSLLSQIYQAEVQYVIANGKYTSELSDLLSDGYCTLENGCFSEDLQLIQENPLDMTLAIEVQNNATTCVKYGDRAPIGGPCFIATLLANVYGKGGSASISGHISEKRKMSVDKVDQDGVCLEVPSSRVPAIFA